MRIIKGQTRITESTKIDNFRVSGDRFRWVSIGSVELGLGNFKNKKDNHVSPTYQTPLSYKRTVSCKGPFQEWTKSSNDLVNASLINVLTRPMN